MKISSWIKKTNLISFVLDSQNVGAKFEDNFVKRIDTCTATSETFETNLDQVDLTLVVTKTVNGELLSHCVKSVQMRTYFWSIFSCIRTEY